MKNFIKIMCYNLLIFSLGFLCAREVQRQIDGTPPTYIHIHIYVPMNSSPKAPTMRIPNEKSADSKLQSTIRT